MCAQVSEGAEARHPGPAGGSPSPSPPVPDDSLQSLHSRARESHQPPPLRGWQCEDQRRKGVKNECNGIMTLPVSEPGPPRPSAFQPWRPSSCQQGLRLHLPQQLDLDILRRSPCRSPEIHGAISSSPVVSSPPGLVYQSNQGGLVNALFWPL